MFIFNKLNKNRERRTDLDTLGDIFKGVGGTLVGSHGLGVGTMRSDYDYLVPLEALLQLKSDLIRYHGFTEMKVMNDKYGTLLRFVNREYSIDAFALTEDARKIYLRTHDIISKLPKQWIEDKTNRVVLTNAIQTALGRMMPLPVTFAPNGYDIKMIPKEGKL